MSKWVQAHMYASSTWSKSSAGEISAHETTLQWPELSYIVRSRKSCSPSLEPSQNFQETENANAAYATEPNRGKALNKQNPKTKTSKTKTTTNRNDMTCELQLLSENWNAVNQSATLFCRVDLELNPWTDPSGWWWYSPAYIFWPHVRLWVNFAPPP